MPDGFDVQTTETHEALTVEFSDYRTSGDVGHLFAALAKAQGEIKNAAKDSQNPHFKSRYADLASVVEACRSPLAKNGIAVVQVPHNEGDSIGVTTVLGHSSGQWISGRIAVKPAKWDAQGVGSVTTYLRRYGLAAMAGVAPADDDDGEAAVGRSNGASETMAPPSRNGKTKPPENPETIKAREEYQRIAQEIANATNPGDPALGLKVDRKDREDVAFIRKHGGDLAADKLHSLAANRIADLHQRMGQ
jgi:hypothetical protein